MLAIYLSLDNITLMEHTAIITPSRTTILRRATEKLFSPYSFNFTNSTALSSSLKAITSNVASPLGLIDKCVQQ